MKTLAIVSVTSGAGATTLAALAFAAARNDPRGAPGLFGTEGSGLVERSGGDEVATVDPQAAIWDVGACTPPDVLDLLRSGGVTVAVAAPATPLGTVDLLRFAASLASTEADRSLLQRVAVVRTGVYGPYRGADPEIPHVGATLRLPYDRRLALPGSTPADGHLARRTRAAVGVWRSYSTWALRA